MNKEEEVLSIEIFSDDVDIVNKHVSKVRQLLLITNDNLEECFAINGLFSSQETLCVAIHRNLVNIADTLCSIRFLSVTIMDMLNELYESLELCVDFLKDFIDNGTDVYDDKNNENNDDNDINDNYIEQQDDVINKLAFMNKLMHLNQHSFQIRLLLELSEHKRINDINGDDKYEYNESLNLLPFKANASYGTLTKNSIKEPRRSVNKDEIVIKNSHHDNYAYAPLAPPTWFARESRQAEWQDLNKQLKEKAPDIPTIIFITGPTGCGKSIYAAMIAQRIHSHLEFHCKFDCSSYRHNNNIILDNNNNNDNNNENEWHAIVPDSETIMRSLMSELQIAGLSSQSEIQRAFQTLMWKAKGIILLTNVHHYDQISKIIPQKGRCVVIVTSTISFPKLFQMKNKTCVIHQKLNLMDIDQSSYVFQHIVGESPNENILNKLYELCDGYALGMQIISNIHLLAHMSWEKILEKFTDLIDENETNFFSKSIKLRCSRKLQRIFYLAYNLFGEDIQTLLGLLHIFHGPFNVIMCAKILQTGSEIVAEDMKPLVQLGLLKPIACSKNRRGSVVFRTDSDEGVPLDSNIYFVFEPLCREFAELAFENCVNDKRVTITKERLQQNYIRYFSEQLTDWRIIIEQQNSIQRVGKWREFDQNMSHIQRSLYLLKYMKNPPKDLIFSICEPHAMYTIRLSARTRSEIYHFYFTGANTSNEANRYRVSNAYRELGEAHSQNGYYEKAIPCFEESHRHAIQIKSKPELKVALVASSLRALSICSEMLSHYDDALNYCIQCRQELEVISISIPLCSLLLYQANLNKRMGSLDESNIICEECVDMCLSLLDISLDEFQNKISKEEKEKKRKHRVTPSISISMSEWSPFPSTIDSPNQRQPYRQSITSNNERNTLMKILAQSLFSWGDNYCRKFQWSEAIEKLKIAQNVSIAADSAKTFALCLRSLINAHDESGQFYRAHCYRARLDQLMKTCELPLF